MTTAEEYRIEILERDNAEKRAIVLRLDRELAELREQMKGGRAKAIEQRDKAEAELAELREAVRAALETLEPVAHRLPASAWNLVYDRLRQLIEEKP